MKDLEALVLDVPQCKIEVDELGALLKTKDEFSEGKELLPFFKEKKQLCAFIGALVLPMGLTDRYANEFSFGGDYASDFIVGNSSKEHYLLIELEDAREKSVFHKKARNATYWGDRFEQGFSQIVDWSYSIHDQRNNQTFRNKFGHGHVKFHGFLLIGRSKFISPADAIRLKWRSEKVTIDNHPVEVLTYDELHEALNIKLQSIYSLAEALAKNPAFAASFKPQPSK